MKLKGKIAIITGGSTGIGKAIAERFISEGALVTVFGIQKPDYNVKFQKVDVSRESEIVSSIANFEAIDILVNNAGIYFQKSVEQTSVEELDRIIDINFKGTFLMSKHTLPLLRKTKGNIINIASCLGVIPEPEATAYCTTKAAIIMLTKCMSQTYASENIRVNVVLPGPIDTPLLHPFFESREKMEKYFSKKPFGRVGKPEEVANVVTFLASDEASFVTGGIYSVDGGESVSSLYTKKRSNSEKTDN